MIPGPASGRRGASAGGVAGCGVWRGTRRPTPTTGAGGRVSLPAV